MQTTAKVCLCSCTESIKSEFETLLRIAFSHIESFKRRCQTSLSLSLSTIKNALLTGNENDDVKGKKEQGYETLLDKKGNESQQDTFISPMTAIYGTG